MSHYQKCLASNVLRIFSRNDKYAYKNLLGHSFKNNKSVFLTVILMNALLLSLSIVTDTLCIAFNVYYWWSVLIRIPLAIISIFSYQVYNDKGLTIIEIVLFTLAVFIPCYSIYLLLYIVGRTFIAEADYYPIDED